MIVKKGDQAVVISGKEKGKKGEGNVSVIFFALGYF